MLIDLCPDRQQLRDFVAGRLPESSLDEIAEHLDTCDQCDASVATLDQESDSFINELRRPTRDEPFINELEFHEAVSAVEAYESDAALPPGTASRNRQIGHYILVERLGTGGMGTVYKALHTRLEKLVALKILRTKRMLDERAIARFEREMKVVGKLKHKNIVQACDAGDADGKQFLVMEYIEGAEFSELIARNGRLSIADACELACQAAHGLQHAHEHGLVHRDVKPSNLMLANDGSVKILDLGLASIAGDGTTSAIECDTRPECDGLTLDGQIMGTVEYIAPEQAENSRDVDIRADIYGLGCTLHSLLVGAPPFQRQNFATPRRLIAAHQASERPSIDDLPPKLARIIHRMLAIDPSDRFSTPAEVAHALSPFTHGADVGALLLPKPESAGEIGRRRDSSFPHRSLIALGILPAIALAVFAAVFLIETPYGAVEIETDDRNVEVSVSQGGREVGVINAASGWDIRLKEGKYNVRLTSGDTKFQLSNNTVTVARNGKVVLRVTLRNGPVAAHDHSRGAADRQAIAKRRSETLASSEKQGRQERQIGVENSEKKRLSGGAALERSAKIKDAGAAGDYRLIVDANQHVADVKLLERAAAVAIPANREYTISCAGKAHNNDNGGDDLFHGVVLFYQDKNDSDGNNSVYTVLRPGETLKTRELYGNLLFGEAPTPGGIIGQGVPGLGLSSAFGAEPTSELRAFFLEANDTASNNSGRFTLDISGAKKKVLVVNAKEHVHRIDEDMNAARLEVPSGARYTVSCSGIARNNTNGGDDLFNGVLVFYQDTMDSDGNRSVYRVLQSGDSFVTDPIYGPDGVGELRACFLAIKSAASDNRGRCTIRVQATEPSTAGSRDGRHH